MGRKFFVGGNFKMNGTVSGIKDIVTALNNAKTDPNVEVVLSPPAIYLLALPGNLDSSRFQLAAQNASATASGAFTGEISPIQLADAKIPWTILGHSERRTLFAEDDALVAKKTALALKSGVKVVFCCGETLGEREKGVTVDVVTKQLDAVAKDLKEGSLGWGDVVVAYEPVWAIGTGKVATTEQAQEVHAAIRAWLEKSVGSEAAEKTRIIYGGSVTEKNCRDLAKEKDIDGFLVGGASLKPAFVDIINSNQ